MSPTLRPKEDQNGWNLFFSILFAVLLFFAVMVVNASRGGFPRIVPLFDTVLIIFAIFRVTRLLVYDKITRWFREWFVFKRTLVGQDGSLWVEILPFGRGLRHTIHELLQCPWCIGVWAALVVTFVYFMFPWAWYLIFMLAVAGAGSLIQVLANAVGWRAENLKLEAKEKEKNS